MVGAGNDFVVIDAQTGLNYKKLTEQVCDRNNGIGADGLLVLDRSKKADYRMRIINADGSEAEQASAAMAHSASTPIVTRAALEKVRSRWS